MKTPYVAMKFIAWASVIALAVASWTPGQEMVRTGFNTQLEHTTAYLLAGIAVLAAYPQKPPWLIAVLLGSYAGLLELGQMYVLGRHAALLDWLASASGVICAYPTIFFYRSRMHRLAIGTASRCGFSPHSIWRGAPLAASVLGGKLPSGALAVSRTESVNSGD